MDTGKAEEAVVPMHQTANEQQSTTGRARSVTPQRKSWEGPSHIEVAGSYSTAEWHRNPWGPRAA
jgi:hypothetical protein